VRLGAVEELAQLVRGTHAPFAAAARLALEALADDDSRRVSDAAARALGLEPPELAVEISTPAAAPQAASPQPVRPRPAPRRRTTNASRLAVAAARTARRQDAVAVAGAALLVLGYFRSSGWDTAWAWAVGFEEDIWLTWGPFEAFGAAVLVAGAALARNRGWAGREAVGGLLLAVGLLVCCAMLAWATSPFVEVRLLGTVGVTTIGGLAIAASGALGVLTRRAREVALARRAVALGAVGVLLGLAPLRVGTGDWSDSALLGGLSDKNEGAAVSLELLCAGLLAIAVLIVLAGAPRLRLHAAGALVGIGTLLALHLAGVAAHIAYYEGVDSLGWGCPLGVVGGLLLVAAGARVLAGARERPPEMAAGRAAP
jgi:hypothetical protein